MLLIQKLQEPAQCFAYRQLLAYHNPRTLTTGFDPAVVQLNEMANVERHYAAAFPRCELELLIIGFSQATMFTRGDGIVAALAKRFREYKMHILIEENPKCHAALAASDAPTFTRRLQ
jgi:hypothetical protein